MLRLPGLGVRSTKPRAWMRAIPKQDAGGDCISIGPGAACVGVCSVYAGDIPDGCVAAEGFVGYPGVGGY